MAHWAKINDENIVEKVLCTDNNDPVGDEGYQWLVDNIGGKWIKTSYNTWGNKHKLDGTPLRKNYAAVGFYYDKIKDAFIPPQPYPEWILDEETCLWNPPDENWLYPGETE